MTGKGVLGGIWSATLTPLDEAFGPDATAAIAYYRELLDGGCDGLNILGTTGEAMSLSLRQRIDFMGAVAGSSLPLQQMMVGTGAASLSDAIVLMQTAFEYGFAGALVMPPFYYRDVRDDGVVDFFARLFANANPPNDSVLLYNFPRMSGITFHLTLVERLLREFPKVIAGVKDSSNDARLQRELIGLDSELRIFPGSEYGLLAARARGAAGCISGTVALWPAVAREVYRSGGMARERVLDAHRAALEPFALIPAVRYLTAQLRGDGRWERVLPPLRALTDEEKQRLDASYLLAERA